MYESHLPQDYPRPWRQHLLLAPLGSVSKEVTVTGFGSY